MFTDSNAYPGHGADWPDAKQKPIDCGSLEAARTICEADPRCHGFTWEPHKRRLWKLVNPNPAKFSKKFGKRFEVHLKNMRSPAPTLVPAQSYDRCIEEARRSGIHLFGAHEAKEAAAQLHRDGFVALRDVLGSSHVTALKSHFDKVAQIARKKIPGGNRGRRRWEAGRFVDKALVVEHVIDCQAVLDTLAEYWGHKDIALTTIDAIVSAPGAEKQDLHTDNPGNWGEHLRGDTAKRLKVYFTMVDHDSSTGSTRFIRGSHKYTARLDRSGKNLSDHVNAACPRGGAVIMDMRTWHSGMANRSAIERPMVGVHFSDGKHHPVWTKWGPHKMLEQSFYRKLSPQAQHVCRQVVKR